MTKIVVISDTHNLHNRITIPNGDLLIHAGDATMKGSFTEWAAFVNWFNLLPHTFKIFVAGNHDYILQEDPVLATSLFQSNVYYLQDSIININGILIYGSPWQPEFGHMAFNLPRGKKLKDKWNTIPKEIDIVVTHGPVYGILDMTAKGDHVGCDELRRAMRRVHPRYHISGHIHEGYGIVDRVINSKPITYINASICDLKYNPVNNPIIIDWS